MRKNLERFINAMNGAKAGGNLRRREEERGNFWNREATCKVKRKRVETRGAVLKRKDWLGYGRKSVETY